MFLNLRIALASLAAHKLRTLLAVLGVFLGALAFTGVQHVSESMVRKAEMEVERLGPNLFMARAGALRFRRSGGVRTEEGVRTFTLADARALAGSVPSVLDAAPFVATAMPVRAEGVTLTAQLVATWPSYAPIRGFAVEYGRFFTAAEEEGVEKVCCLGRKIAERLFGDPEKALGRTVLFYRAGFQVVGVLEGKGADITGTDQDEQVFVPLSTYMRRAANQDWITGVYLRLDEEADLDMVKASATAILRSRHKIDGGEKEDFSLLSARETMELRQQALDLVQTLGLMSSSVSFAVGGLGILSIMILMVRARRLEIGVRRAVGARRKDIVRQFLFEAGVMAGIGGAFGVVGGLGLTLTVCAVGGFPFVFMPWLLLVVLAGSLGLGLLSGAYPAWQASRIEILDVLRSRE